MRDIAGISAGADREAVGALSVSQHEGVAIGKFSDAGGANPRRFRAIGRAGKDRRRRIAIIAAHRYQRSHAAVDRGEGGLTCGLTETTVAIT